MFKFYLKKMLFSGICFLGGGGSSSPPPVPAPPPAPETTQASRQAQMAERRRTEEKQGRRASILTGSQGVTEQAPGMKKTLLGA